MVIFNRGFCFLGNGTTEKQIVWTTIQNRKIRSLRVFDKKKGEDCDSQQG